MAACNEIKGRYDINSPILSSISILDPTRALSQKERDITPSILPLISLLPSCTDKNESILQQIDDEWRCLPNYVPCIEDDLTKTIEPDNIDNRNIDDQLIRNKIGRFILVKTIVTRCASSTFFEFN